jgi:hypothetical protein
VATAISIARGRRLGLTLPRLDASGLLTGTLYLVFFGAGFASFTDPDYWWHLRTGQYIVQTHSIPSHDIFSFTVLDKYWLMHEWLSEVVIYLSVSHLGYTVTLGLFILITLISFALMQRLLLRLRTPPMAAVLLVTLGLMISAPYWTVRPQVLSWAFTALFISVLFQQRKPVWPLVPVMTLWANLHLEFVLGLVVATLWFLSRVWERHAEHTDFQWRSGALFVIACAAATLLNPYGPLLPLHAVPAAPFVGGGNDLKSISEWASPNFHDPIHAPLLLGIMLLIALTITGRVRDRFAVLLALTFTVFALYSSRFQPLFAIAFLPAAGLAARDLPVFQRRARPQSRSAVNWALIGLTAMAVLVAIPSLPNAQVYRQARSEGRLSYPKAALTWIEENRPDANVFANYTWGGYILNGLYPRGHVFIDGRSEMYGKRVIDDYRTIIAANDGWQELLESSGANAVVVSPTSKLASALRKTDGWMLTLETKKEIVFVRQ